MLLLTFLDWLFCFGTRARGALELFHSNERGAMTAVVALISVTTSATLLASTTISSADISFDALANTVRSSVDRVSANLEVRGSVIARSKDASEVDRIELTLGVFGESAVLLDDKAEGERLTISYRDDATFLPSVPYTASFINSDGDGLLERGELAAVVLDLSQLPGVDLGANDRFTLELTAPVGGTVEISRTLPFVLQPVMSLH